MQEVIRQIELLHKEMEDLTLKAGVGVEMYNSVISADEYITNIDLKNRLDFLKNIYPLFERVRYLWSLNKPEVWANYTLFKLGFLAEKVQLREANRNLRQAWRKKYGKVKQSNKEADKEDSSGESIQSIAEDTI